MKRLIHISALFIALISSATSAALANPTEYLSGAGDILIHLDLKRLQSSQTFKDLSGMVLSTPAAKRSLAEFKAKFGMDLMADVQSVTLELTAPDPQSKSARALGHVRAKVDANALLSGVKGEGGEVKEVKVGGRTIHHITYKDGQPEVGLELVSGGFIFGTLERVKAAKRGAFGKTTSALAQLATSLKAGERDVWFGVHMSPAMIADAKAKNPMMATFKQIQGFIDLASGLHINVNATAKQAAVAQQMVKDAQAKLKAASSQPQAAMFASVINKINLSAEGATIKVDVPLNQQEVNQLKMIAGIIMMGMQNRAKAPAPKVAPMPVSPAPSHNHAPGHNHAH